jgi:hypothetical protein
MRLVLNVVLVALLCPVAGWGSDTLRVHEWGTFTSLQDESGQAIGGLNSSDEPLPMFVHRLRAGLISNDNPFSKGIVRAHPDVTMRLETPVVYFHPPKDAGPMTVDVSAVFHGGLLSEFYPAATAGAQDVATQHITAQTRGTLAWKSVRVGDAGAKLPETSTHVWLAPRQAAAATVSVGGESEKYLFYRGVGHLNPPVRVVRSEGGDAISIFDNRTSDKPLPPLKLGGMWLAEFRDDGAAAFRAIDVPPAPGEAKARAIPAAFSDQDFAVDNVGKLRAAMQTALVADGPYPDEAEAMLETWKLSYFKAGGQRLFFLVPRAWTDQVLPLEIKAPLPVELTRVMVGRIELVTPAQRDRLSRIAATAASQQQIATLYAQLGRFAAALVLEELRARPSGPLLEFARASGIVPAPAPAGPATQPVAAGQASRPLVLVGKE